MRIIIRLPIAWIGGPNKKGKEVTYTQARTILQDFLLDYGISNTSVKDAIAANSLDSNAPSGSSVADTPLLEKTPMTKSTKNIEAKEAWCNPRADDECTNNGKIVYKVELKQYLPAVYELEVRNAGGYCEYPVCHDKNDNPAGIN